MDLCQDGQERLDISLRHKREYSLTKLAKNCAEKSDTIIEFAKNIDQMKFHEKPDYKYLMSLLKRAAKKF